ncbi:MAG TPA: flagellar export chaperone FliS [Clostridiales bacterium]|nr:flagellar export chaperone FliS [Clostridiales bacterium]
MNSPYKKYVQQSITSLTAGEQLVLLLEKACLNISRAIDSIEKKDIETAHALLVKTQDIYYYLIESLDMSFPISKNLLSLYNFIIEQLTEANIKKDAEILKRIQKLATELKDTWKQAEYLARVNNTAGKVASGGR